MTHGPWKGPFIRSVTAGTSALGPEQQIAEVCSALTAMSPLFRCLICGKDIERSTRSFWRNKGHLLCSSCKDQLEAGESKGLRSPGESLR
jgi:hypothetical protein